MTIDKSRVDVLQLEAKLAELRAAIKTEWVEHGTGLHLLELAEKLTAGMGCLSRMERMETALERLRETDGPIVYLERLAIIHEALKK